VRPDLDGVHRQEWRGVALPHGPVVAVRAAATVVTPRAPATPSAAALYEARMAAWERRIADAVDDAAVNGEAELTAGELTPWIAANLLETVDREIAGVVDKLRVEAGALRRELESERERRMDERRRRVTGTAALRKQVAALDAALQAQAAAHAAALAEMRKGLAALELGAARDRSLRRLTDARIAYPRADRAALEKARRATDLAVAGTELEHGEQRQ
jgi:phage terminase small subunit